MTQPGPSKEYRDLLNGRLSPDEYLREVKKDVDRRLRKNSSGGRTERTRSKRAAVG